MIVTDEERYPTRYELEDKYFIEEYNKMRPGYDLLKKNGIEYTNHYTAATACTASRSTLYTGMYPSVTKVHQTLEYRIITMMLCGYLQIRFQWLVIILKKLNI